MLTDKELVQLDLLSDRQKFVSKLLSAYFSSIQRGDPVAAVCLEEDLRRILDGTH